MKIIKKTLLIAVAISTFSQASHAIWPKVFTNGTKEVVVDTQGEVWWRGTPFFWGQSGSMPSTVYNKFTKLSTNYKLGTIDKPIVKAITSLPVNNSFNDEQFSGTVGLLLAADGKIYALGGVSGDVMLGTEGVPAGTVPKKVDKILDWIVDIDTPQASTQAYVSLLNNPPLDLYRGHVLALTAKGEVYAWGANHYGQLGLGIADATLNKPTKIPNLINIEKIGTRHGASFALTKDGQLYVWGKNDLIDGGIGVGQAMPLIINTPTLINIRSKIIDFVTTPYLKVQFSSNNLAPSMARAVNGMLTTDSRYIVSLSNQRGPMSKMVASNAQASLLRLVGVNSLFLTAEEISARSQGMSESFLTTRHTVSCSEGNAELLTPGNTLSSGAIFDPIVFNSSLTIRDTWLGQTALNTDYSLGYPAFRTQNPSNLSKCLGVKSLDSVDNVGSTTPTSSINAFGVGNLNMSYDFGGTWRTNLIGLNSNGISFNLTNGKSSGIMNAKTSFDNINAPTLPVNFIQSITNYQFLGSPWLLTSVDSASLVWKDLNVNRLIISKNTASAMDYDLTSVSNFFSNYTTSTFPNNVKILGFSNYMKDINNVFQSSITWRNRVLISEFDNNLQNYKYSLIIPAINSPGVPPLAQNSPLNGAAAHQIYFSVQPPFSYKFLKAADFNGDNILDYLFEDSENNLYIYSPLNDSSIPMAIAPNYSSPYIKNSVLLGRKVIGVGDINGDNNADVFVQDPITKMVSVLISHNGKYSGISYDIAIPALNQKLVSIGDNTGDGKVDMYWQNTVTGEVESWQLSNLGLLEKGIVNLQYPASPAPSPNYKIINNDGL